MTQREKEELVAMLVSAAYLLSAPQKPGALLSKLMSKYGDKINQLTSDDFANVRTK
jgi:hypothetical protein